MALYGTATLNEVQTVSEYDYLNGYAYDVIAAIGFFAFSVYKLSCELLTKAFCSTTDSAEEYTPLHSDIIYSSKILWDCYESGLGSGSLDFNLHEETPFGSLNSNEKDLAFSLGNVSFSRKGNLYSFSDTYDFDMKSPGDGLLNKLFTSCVNVIYHAQELGIIKNYPIRFDIDLSKCLKSDIQNEKDSYALTVKNISEEPIQLIYNSKMSFENDAMFWKNLNNIKYVPYSLSPRESCKIVISKNLLTTTLALSYVTSEKRYVTYINELDKEDHKQIKFHEMEYNTYECENLNFSFLGVNDSKYILKVKNGSSTAKTITYSEMMATKNECVDSLSSLQTSLNSNGDCYLEIERNGANKYVQLKVADLKTEKHFEVYVSKTNGETELDVYCKKETPIYTYLSLSNKNKKDGKWSIDIYNPYDTSIEVEYNTKKCFEADAKNWTKLNDIASVSCAPKSWTNVLISTYFFGTTIAISYCSEGKRIISYANESTTSGGMKIMYNVKG